MSSASTLAASVALLVLTVGSSHAQPPEATTLKLATVAPEGTAWARELRSWAHDVEAGSEGAVRIKWYFGGIAGDEMQMVDRLRRHQLDGVASGGPLCERIAPSMKVMRVLGLIRDHDETVAVISRLKPLFEQEANAHGFVFNSASPIGPQIVFTRRPVRSMDELRRIKLWVWEYDDVLRRELAFFSVDARAGTLDEAGPLYDAGKVDGLVTPASVALAFQWSARTRYVIELPLATLTGCTLLTRGAFDALAIDAQHALRAATAKLQARFTDVSRQQDAELLGGLFQKQGLTRITIDERFAAEFYDVARRAREKLDESLVSRELIARVQSILADYRAQIRPRAISEHGARTQ